MKLSEYINYLYKKIEEHGDLEMAKEDSDGRSTQIVLCKPRLEVQHSGEVITYEYKSVEPQRFAFIKGV